MKNKMRTSIMKKEVNTVYYTEGKLIFIDTAIKWYEKIGLP
jgi:hypothetical protein